MPSVPFGTKLRTWGGLGVLVVGLVLGTAKATAEPWRGGSLLETVQEDQAGSWDPDPSIVFLGDFSEKRRAELTARVTDVMSYFAEQFNALAPDFALYIANNDDLLRAEMVEVLGFAHPLQCGLAHGTVAFVQDWCADGAIAHEYFHALQTTWSSDGRLPQSDTGWARGAWWLVEGTATYAATLYDEHSGRTEDLAGRQGMDFHRWAASYHEGTLEDLVDYVPWIASTPYDLAALAIDWLISQTSQTAVAAYFRVLPNSSVWTDAVEHAFGMDVETIHRNFAEYRARTVPTRRAVMGRVIGADANPVRRWRLDVEAYPSNELDNIWVRADTTAPGVFGNLWLRLPDGEYDLALMVRCGKIRRSIGWLTTGGQLVPERADAEPVVVDGRDISGVALRMDLDPSEVFPECDFGSLHEVRGVVVGPDGRPLSGIHLSAWDTIGWGESGQDHTFSNANGEFVFRLPQGEYGFGPRLLSASLVSSVPAFVADHYDELRFSTPWNVDFALSTETIVVQGDHVSDLHVQILNVGACYEHQLLQALAKNH